MPDFEQNTITQGVVLVDFGGVAHPLRKGVCAASRTPAA